MEIQEFLHLIKNKKQTIAIVMIIFVMIAVAFTFVQPMRYSSISKVLVIQSLGEGAVDPYQVSKSNEYVASLLTQVVSTNSFYREVINSGFNINKDYFPETDDKQMKLWKKIVKVSSNSSGIITIKTYHDNRVQVDQISQAINFILKSKHKLYHGFADLVNIKIIEQPVTSDRPIKPNVFINISVALAFGILVSLTYVYLFPDNRYNLHLSTKKNNSLASDDIESGQDEFAIKNYDDNVATETNYNEAVKDDVAEEIRKIKRASRENKFSDVQVNLVEDTGSPPSDLPISEVGEEIVEESVVNNDDSLINRQPRDIQKQGSMSNIINQPSQRS